MKPIGDFFGLCCGVCCAWFVCNCELLVVVEDGGMKNSTYVGGSKDLGI
jgi:hypothetical protein